MWKSLNWLKLELRDSMRLRRHAVSRRVSNKTMFSKFAQIATSASKSSYIFSVRVYVFAAARCAAKLRVILKLCKSLSIYWNWNEEILCVCNDTRSGIPGSNALTLQTHRSTLQHTAAHCNTLLCSSGVVLPLQTHSTHCNTLQDTTCKPLRTQHPCPYTANTLQHSATHCNTLQHTATHYFLAAA